jgi:hypothetical protein
MELVLNRNFLEMFLSDVYQFTAVTFLLLISSNLRDRYFVIVLNALPVTLSALISPLTLYPLFTDDSSVVVLVMRSALR